MARKKSRRRSPGEGSVYWRADIQKWQAMITIGFTPAGNPRRIGKAFKEKADALAWLADQQKLRSRGADLSGSTATVEDAFNDWINHLEAVEGRKPATIATYRNAFTRNILPYRGAVRLRDLTPGNIRSWLRQLKLDGRSDSGIKRAHSYLGILLNDCVRMELIDTNPAKKVTPPSAPKPAKSRLSLDDARSLLVTCEQVDDQAARYTIVALGTALRTEELLGLTWAGVDWEHKALDIATFAEGTGAKALVDEGKNERAIRRVHVEEAVLDALERQRAYVSELQRGRAELDAKRAQQGEEPLGWTDLNLVFCTSLGTILDRTTLRRQFNKLQEKAGIEEANRLRLYGTRHTHLSILADAGVSLLDLQERAGHSDPRFTARVYLSGTEDTRRRVAARAADLLRSNSVAEAPEQPETAAPDTTREANNVSAETLPQTALPTDTDR